MSLTEGSPDEAAQIIQKLIDEFIPTEAKEDRGWYLQETARYTYLNSKTQANEIQVKAHKLNKLLLRPKSGMKFEKLVGQKRIENIKTWLRTFENNEAMLLAVEEIAGNSEFGVSANDFEEAFDRLGVALGFRTQRPDKEWKEGPDNLWAVRDGEYLLTECKSEVELSRPEIYKAESGQMNNACAWFKNKYSNAKVTNLLIIPTKTISKAAGFNEPVGILRKSNLKKLVHNFKSFFSEFKNVDLHDVSDDKVQEFLKTHALSVHELLGDYSEIPKPA